MSELISILEERLGAKKEMNTKWGTFFIFNSTQTFGASYLMTKGLSDFEMKVHEKHLGEEFNELYFLLPSYWDLEDLQNEKFNWVFPWLNRLHTFVIEKNTWFGHGHTIPCGNPFEALSSSMRQNHFMLTRPIEANLDLKKVETQEKNIGFLGIIPIFEDEMDFKQGKGTAKLMDKLRVSGITEKLDDFRVTSLKKKWRFMKR